MFEYADNDKLRGILGFATEKHKGQVRKYTGLPYITHPIAVAGIVDQYTKAYDPALRTLMLGACLLHDVIEDCGVSREEIAERWGEPMAETVDGLTHRVVPGGNRAERKAADLIWLAGQSSRVHTIKAADMVDNTATILAFDPGFAKRYTLEKTAVLQVIIRAEPALLKVAQELNERNLQVVFGGERVKK